MKIRGKFYINENDTPKIPNKDLVIEQVFKDCSKQLKSHIQHKEYSKTEYSTGEQLDVFEVEFICLSVAEWKEINEFLTKEKYLLPKSILKLLKDNE